MFACEYYVRGNWVKFYIDKRIEKCREIIDMPIFADPPRRIVKYEVKGNKWKLMEVVG